MDATLKLLPWLGILTLSLSTSLVGCNDGNHNHSAASPGEPTLYVGAASRSVLPTVSGSREYLQEAPGWPAASTLNPDNPGVFVPVWDQGRVDIGNGNSDGSWVHDDVRATAVALQRE